MRESDEFANRKKNLSLNKNIFKTSLPNIPLNRVFEERAKIKAMILDIKTNIHKMDKY